jgi:hypothetical protein
MGVSCYVKKQSRLPRCGVHDVVLEQVTIPIDEYAPHLGLVTCYVCPISLSVLEEAETKPNTT